MSKHKQGPWHWKPMDGFVVDENGFEVAEVWACARRSEHRKCLEANARLIAAAPELLEIAEWAVKVIDACDGSPTQGDIDCIHEALSGVVHKATGEWVEA